MAKKLTLICDEKSVVDTQKLCKTLYSVSGQNDELSAEISYVSATEIQRLNREFRNVDKVTDVLSFPTLDGVRGKAVLKKDFPLDLSFDGKSVFIGSIAVCVEKAKAQAEEYGHSLTRELTYLICHGLLHLLGYDHILEEDKVEMRALEEKIMNEIKVLR